MSYDEIGMAHVDGLCKAFRERGKCFVREASTYAKKRKTIWNFLAIYQAYHNLIKTKQGETPCMKEGIVSKVWSWEDLFYVKLPYVN